MKVPCHMRAQLAGGLLLKSLLVALCIIKKLIKVNESRYKQCGVIPHF